MQNKLLTLILISILLFNSNLYSQCATGISWTVNPAPTNGGYAPGTTVSICYTIGGFTQTGTNWLDGMVFSFGSGWDISTLNITSFPTSCSGNGYWGYFTSVTSSSNGGVFGPGVYYDYNLNPGNPGNDFGDNNGAGVCSWTLCFDITTGPTVGADVSLGITPTGDGTTGSWGNGSCPGVLDFGIDPGVVIISPCAMTISISSVNPTCAYNDGSAVVTQSNGLGQIIYQWDNGVGDSSNTGLAPGTYCVDVKDSTGCVISACVDLVINDSTVVNASITNPISCLGYCDGELQAQTTFGTAPFTFLWSNASTDQSIINVCSGTYDVTVTDANQCTDVSTVTLIDPPGMLLASSGVDVSCFAGSDGQVSVNIITGTAPYNFIWNPSNQISQTATNVSAGSYTVTVTDANGCTASSSVSINQPLSIIMAFTATDASCFGGDDGTIEVNAINGNPPYSYVWSNGGTDFKILNLTAGTYTVTVIDQNGCNRDSSETIGEAPALVNNFTTDPSSCEIAVNGSAFVQSFGGTPPYSYSWNTGSIVDQIINVLADEYFVTVTDANGCTDSSSVIIASEPDFTVDAGPNIELIKGNSAEINAYPSVFDQYYFTWTPTTFIDNAGDNNVVVNPTVTTTYIITAINANTGCTATDDVVVNVLPNALLLVPSVFSPNFDAVNNTIFPIAGDGVKINSFAIYNRWGVRMFDAPIEPGWDGTFNGVPQDIGVYTYYCEYTSVDDGEKYRKQGTILLAR